MFSRVSTNVNFVVNELENMISNLNNSKKLSTFYKNDNFGKKGLSYIDYISIKSSLFIKKITVYDFKNDFLRKIQKKINLVA